VSNSLQNQIVKINPETLELFLDSIQERIADSRISPQLANVLLSDLQHVSPELHTNQFRETLDQLEVVRKKSWDFAIIDGDGKQYAKAYLNSQQAKTHTVSQLEKKLLSLYGSLDAIKAKPISIQFNPDSELVRSLPLREPYKGASR
jgi:hypothetical protein